jgi:hypothetical protein
MNISYEIIKDGNVVRTVTGTELREQFGVGPTNPIFTEQLVQKFNLTNECSDNPERMRQTVSIYE